MEFRGKKLTALGLLVTIAALLFVWGMFYLLGNPIFAGGFDVIVAMEHGSGLKRGDRVQVNGVTVGSVRTVMLKPNREVLATVRLDSGTELAADTRAIVRGDVFGAHTVELIPGDAMVTLQRGDTIRGVAARELTDVLADLGGQAASVLGSADKFLSDEAAADLHSTVAVLPESARELQQAMVNLRETSAALRRTIESVEESGTAESMNRVLNELESGARAFTGAAESLDRSLQAVEESFAALTSILQKIDDGNGTLGRLVNDTSLYKEVEDAIREVRQLTADIRAQPQRYINLRIF